MSEPENKDRRSAALNVDDIGTFEVPLGLNLREALRREGVYLDGTCSDNGTCGRCVVRVIKGDAGQPSTQERGLLGEKAVTEGKRLSCRIRVSGDLRILVDPEHMLELDRTGKWKEVWDSPLWRPDLFTADRSGYGIAVDIGTSSVVSSLLDLSLGRPMDLKTAANPQMPWGEDIISRLDKAAADPVTADRLRRLIWETIARQVRSLCLRNGISGGRIGQMVIVGNSAMHHLAIGAPARELILPPYSPADRSAVTL
ncbi:MAG: 2Fe-2S iron-sulfur cluster-binding protein, partial [Pseudomonadota bacterium]